MNKNNFMKAMSMIDEKLIHEADTPYTTEISADTYNENETTDAVTGVDVYHGIVWKKFLAVAATLVLVVGAVGGGIYHFSQIKEDNNNITEEDNGHESVYSRLKENKDLYSGEFTVDDGISLRFKHVDIDIEPFINYMDTLGTDDMAEEKDVLQSGRSITINFYEKNDPEESDDKIKNGEPIYDTAPFTFTLYENGCYIMKDNENAITNTDRFADGSKIFNDILKLYTDEESLENINTLTLDEADVFLNTAFAGVDPDKVYHYSDGQEKGVRYTIDDRESLKNDLLNFEWIRTEEFDYTDYYSLNGFDMSEHGYIAANYNGCKVICKLKDEVEIEKFVNVFPTHFMLAAESSDPESIESSIKVFTEARNAQWLEGLTGVPQGKTYYDTNIRYYAIIDSAKFIDELSLLKWTGSTEAEIEAATGETNEEGLYYSNGSYTLREGDKTLCIYPNGYMSIDGIGYYKLENEGDTEQLKRIFDECLILDQFSDFADQINKGINNYENLTAHYTYTIYNANGEKEEISGNLSVDAGNEKMYMTGEGTNYGQAVTMEIVMNGHDTSAARVTEKETGANQFIGAYRYSNESMTPPPENHYIYFCKDIEKSLTPRGYSAYDNCMHFTIDRTDEGGKIITYNEMQAENGNGTDKDVTLVLSRNGQVISYSVTSPDYNVSFVLDDYVFDSPDFTMENTEYVYDSIMKEQNDQYSAE